MPLTALSILAVTGLAANFADKVLMIILGLSIVVPTVFLVAAVLVSRRFDHEPDRRDGE